LVASATGVAAAVRAWDALLCLPRRRVACHLPSQGGQSLAMLYMLFNLLKEKL